jgi:hypothetical protein
MIEARCQHVVYEVGYARRTTPPDSGDYMLKDYDDVKDRVARQTRLRLETFPETCPWTAEQILDTHFWPEAEVSS